MSTATMERTNTRKLPVIDVSGLRGDPGTRRAVAREMRAACTASGFFYIKGHGVPGALIDQVFDRSHEFFALPMEQKLALTMAHSLCRHGYEPLKAQTLEPGAPPDLKEGFLAGEDFAADHPAVRNDPANIGPNQWPPQLPQFKTTMIAYVEEMKALTAMLMGGLALSLDLAEDYFDDFCDLPSPDAAAAALSDAAAKSGARREGLRRPYGLGEHYDTFAGRCGWIAGPSQRWLVDIGAADRRNVCGQYRRSVRAMDQQPVPIHCSPRDQQVRSRSLFRAVLHGWTIGSPGVLYPDLPRPRRSAQIS